MQAERIRVATREWVERKVRVEQRLALVFAGVQALACVIGTAVLWWVVVLFVFVCTKLLGVPGGWWNYLIIVALMGGLYGWHARMAVKTEGVPPVEPAPSWLAIPGLVLGTIVATLGGRMTGALWFDAARRHGPEAGRVAANGCLGAALLGPVMMVRTWLALRRYAALGAVDTQGCASVIGLCLEHDAELEFEALERLLPHLSVTQLRSDLLLFDGVRILPGPPPALALDRAAADEISTIVGAQAAPAVARPLSA